MSIASMLYDARIIIYDDSIQHSTAITYQWHNGPLQAAHNFCQTPQPVCRSRQKSNVHRTQIVAIRDTRPQFVSECLLMLYQPI